MLPRRVDSRQTMPSRSGRINRALIAETGIIPAGLQLIQDSFDFSVLEKKEVMVEDAHGREMPVMRVSGLIQQGDVHNANSRFYDTGEVLAPAVRNIQEDVHNRAVIGEYDHPCLTTDDFMVLTKDGWRPFVDIKIGDVVYSRVNGHMVQSRVNGIVNKPFIGDVYHFEGRHINTTFTGDHKTIMDTRADSGYSRKQVQATVDEIYSDRKGFNKHIIPRVASWSGVDQDFYVVPGVETKRGPNYHNTDVTQDLVFDTKLFVSFLGIWLAEGNLVSNYGIVIHQKRGEKADEIAEMLKQFPSDLKWVRHKTGFYLSDARLHKYLKPLGDKYTKFIPNDIKQLDAKYLEELVYWFRLGDGRSKHGRNNVFTVSKQLINDLHECHVKSGGCCYEAAIEPKNDYQFAGHTILAVNKKLLYQLTLSQTAGIHMDDRFLKITKQHHDGRVYCLITEHGSFYVQHNGFSFWTGNCDAKIHLDRASHLMTKVWMDGRKVYGEAEVLHKVPCGAALRGMFEHKVRMGISSRGVGDMEVMEHKGHEIYRVMPGYAFVTWDCVAEPSVSGAILNIQEGLTKRLRPIRQQKHLFTEEVYQDLLVSEINKFFDIKPKRLYRTS